MESVSERLAYVVRLLAPLAYAALIIAVACVVAAAVVIDAIVGDIYKSVAVSLVCVPVSATSIMFALLYFVTVREMQARAAPPVRVIEGSSYAPHTRLPVHLPPSARLHEIGGGRSVDITTAGGLADAIASALKPHTPPTQANIKAVLPVSDNNRITEAMHELRSRGDVYTSSDGKTSRYVWVDEPRPAPHERPQNTAQ